MQPKGEVAVGGDFCKLPSPILYEDTVLEFSVQDVNLNSDRLRNPTTCILVQYVTEVWMV